MESLIIAVFVVAILFLVEAIVKMVRIGKLRGWSANDEDKRDVREFWARWVFAILFLVWALVLFFKY